MADPDPSVSNGTCFFMPAVYFLSDRSYIPCGNAAFGNIHCCQAGDHCLEEGACYNEEYGTTYLAGCTDFNYKDVSCPDKKAYWCMAMMTIFSYGIAWLTKDHHQITHGLA